MEEFNKKGGMSCEEAKRYLEDPRFLERLLFLGCDELLRSRISSVDAT